jgi:hypothetical protein
LRKFFELLSAIARVAQLVDALARGEIAKLNLRGEDGELVVVEE